MICATDFLLTINKLRNRGTVRSWENHFFFYCDFRKENTNSVYILLDKKRVMRVCVLYETETPMDIVDDVDDNDYRESCVVVKSERTTL